MNSLRDVIRDTIENVTTVNFGKGPIGLLPETVINRLTTELTDAVLDTAMFNAIAGEVCTCHRERIEKDDRLSIPVRFLDPGCRIHASERV